MSITSVINDTVTSVSLVNAQKPLPPTISGYSVGGLDDTALDPAGGQTVQINGTGFLAGATITFDGSAVAVVTFSSANRLTFTSPAKSAGTYTIYVVNPDGGTAIYIPGVIYSLLPTWTTGAGTLGSYYETTSISNTVVASGDAPITYSLYSGSLPTGSTLSSGGVITGTAPVDNSSTTYSFTIEAIDAQLQSSTRSFSLTINTDVVTWVSPANATTYTSAVNSAIANVTLSATDAAGYAVTYSANALPTGLSLSGANISGTPTVIADSSTLLTATAATTNRTATRTINWSITVANDPYFEYNTLLIPGASTTFVDDASTNNFAVTIAGDTKPNSMNPYSPGYYSNYLANNTYLTAPANTALSLGTGNFTIEAWIYATASFGTNPIFECRSSSSSASGYAFLVNGSVLRVYSNGGWAGISTTTLQINTWYHVALVRSGTGSNQTTFYVNGVAAGSFTFSANLTDGSSYVTSIGTSTSTGEYWNGYLSNARIVKGTAVYTGNFTPSTTPLTAVSGTSLLTCQSNRFIDNSTNNFTLTVSGAVTVNSFQPFTPNSSYSTYGSAYSDGNGDYIAVADNSNLAFGTGDYTIEMWVYLISYAQSSFWESNPFGTTGQRPNGFIWYQASGVVYVFFNGSNFLISSANVIPLAQWAHIALVRNSGATAFYVNGVNVAAASTTYNSTNGAGIVGAFCDGGTYSINGYISNLRAVKGTAVYTSNFTPPSAPLTAISGTSLLTLQNNQSVNNSVFLDNSSNNFLVTRNGNTTQGTFSPYGGNWSNYFDGTGDYLSLSSNSAFDLGTEAYTVEAWVYLTSYAANEAVMFCNGNSNGAIACSINTGGQIYISKYGSGQVITGSAGDVPLNQWNHLAYVRSSTASNGTRLYVNGVLKATGTDSNNWNVTTTPTVGALTISGFGIIGNISNVRVVKGTAVYTTTFTPSTTPLTVISGTSLLTCQSNRLIDNSINNFTITKNGDTSVQRFSPFNPSSVTPTSYSGYFDGSGDWLSGSSWASAGQFGTSDFTVECWVYATAAPNSNQVIWGCNSYPNTTGLYLAYYGSSGTNLGLRTGATTLIDSSAGWAFNTWLHVAVVRASGTLTLYINGTSRGSTTFTNNCTDGLQYIGRPSDVGIYSMQGYISNFRIVKGTAVYTSNFTPSTTPLTAIANTSLLTCQSTTFIDNSNNNFVITAAGNTQPTIQNPFGYTSTTTNGYSVSTIGGSGYFDGTGDYLQIADSEAVELGSGNFTIEGWMYFNSGVSYNAGMVLTAKWNSGNYSYLAGVLNNAGTMQTCFQYTTSGSGSAVTLISGSLTFNLNTWYHLAFVRNSGSFYIFVNGVLSTNNATISGTLYNGTEPLAIGRTGDGFNYMNGYISDLRVVKGTALYTSNFVPPSAPLTAITNTALLTNMTNAGIYDAAMINDMESVGDAKLSTAVSKFGGSSMYFDGTGDWLFLPSNTTLALGSGDFTVEMWMYPNLTYGSTYAGLLDSRTNADGAGLVYFGYTGTANQIGWKDNTTNVVTGTVTQSTWNHVAVVRSSGTMKLYINGTSVSTGSNSTNYTVPFKYIATSFDPFSFNGYIDDLRITRGYARYTSNFTAPTSAFPIY